MLTTLSVYCDGGSRGNPGQASYGFVVIKDSNVIFSEGKRIGIATNNVAEYSAVIAALEHVLNGKYEFQEVNFFLDSQLAVNQLNGNWKIKNDALRILFQKAKELEKKIGKSISYTAIPREKNKLADKQVNLALDNLI